MKFCTECGKKIAAENKFCSFCGAAVPSNIEESISENIENADVEKEEGGEENSSTEISGESVDGENIKDKGNKNKSLIIAILSGIVILLLIPLVIIFININNKSDLLSSEVTIDESSEKQISDSSKDVDTIVEEETLFFSEDEISLTSIDAKSYPGIKAIFDLNTDKKILEENLNLTIKENGKIINDFHAKSLEENSNKQLVLTYTSEYINDTYNTQRINLDFDFDSTNILSEYSVPARQELSPKYVSYNTDSYPEVTMYLSFMDINDDITNAILENPDYYKMYENGNSIAVNRIDKLSEGKESLSIDIVMDTSGSMNGRKLDTIIYVAHRFVENMNMDGKDTVALMSFSDMNSIKQYPFVNDTTAIKNEIQNLDITGNSTSLYKAMQEAVMETAYNGQSGSKYIIVFTDGEDNDSGYVTAGTVINDALQYGVQIYSVGMNEDSELRNIAESTGGEYFTTSSNLDGLYELYESIYEKKKNQYAISYTSNIEKKQRREIDLEYDSPLFTSTYQGEVIPKLVDDVGVINAMRNYQINWSRVLNELDVRYLYDYTNTENQSDTSCFKIAQNQVNRKSRETNTHSDFSTPIFNLVSAYKVSSTHYQLGVNKKFVQKYYENGYLQKTFYIGKTYDYNVIYKDNRWVVDSVTKLDVPMTFYTDNSFTTVKNN